MAVEEAYELAYREAVRALDHQLAALTELRSRAGMLLATASIAVSLLGHETFDATRPIGWLAVLCFALLSMCVLAVVWPRPDAGFDADPRVLLAVQLARGAPDAGAVRLDLIAHLATCHSANAQRLKAMSKAFRIGACLLASQIVLTLGALVAIV